MRKREAKSLKVGDRVFCKHHRQEGKVVEVIPESNEFYVVGAFPLFVCEFGFGRECLTYKLLSLLEEK